MHRILMEKENDSKWEYELNVLIDQATNHKGRENHISFERTEFVL